MLQFNFILGLNFISLNFKLIITHDNTQKQGEIKFENRQKLNDNICSKTTPDFPWIGGTYNCVQ